MEIKVITYNIHKGFNTGNQRFVLTQIRELLEQERADLVFLQEVHGATRRHKSKLGTFPDIPHFEYLADKLWPHYAYGKNAIYRKGHHGNAILSKYPFKFWENIDISNHRLASRSILHGIIELPGGIPLHTLCVHMGLFQAERTRQLDRLIERIANHVPQSEPMLIAGDFNDWKRVAEQHFEQDLEVRELFEEITGRHALTYPVWLPMLPMDRIYFRGLNPVSCTCLASGPWRKLSDHAALSGIYRIGS
ncbi:MAG: endonuclease/exonuclease/phosphatase family protein [Pseudomonas sp.]